MNLLLRSRPLRRLLGGFFLIASCALLAADLPPSDARLVISNGNVTIGTSNGRPARATLRTVADELTQRYPSVTINIVGVEDVVVGDLSLRWPQRHASVVEEDTVAAILAAVSESLERPAFLVSRPSKNHFLLSRLPAHERPAASRRIDVFNLKLLLEGAGDKAAIEVEVRQLELRLQTLSALHDRIAAEVSTGRRGSGEQNEVKNEIAMVKEHLQLGAKRLKRASPSKEETTKRLDQLIEVVRTTLEKLSPSEKMPEFEYHAGSYLLVVIGSDAAIDVTRKVVTALEKSSG